MKNATFPDTLAIPAIRDSRIRNVNKYATLGCTEAIKFNELSKMICLKQNERRSEVKQQISMAIQKRSRNCWICETI